MEQSFDKAGEYYSQALAIATTPEARSQIEGNIKQLQARIAAAVKAENKKRKERPDEEGDEGGERGTKKPRMDSSSLQKKA